MTQLIRPFASSDRSALRQIAFETAFMGDSARIFFEGQEFLKDALTLYFTDYEPESAWVAQGDEGIIGYIMGARDEQRMDKVILTRIIPRLVVDALRDGLLLRGRNIKLLGGFARSLFKGEFSMPSFSKTYPAVLHINIKKDSRGQGTGDALMKTLLDDFTKSGVQGVRLATMSSGASGFFCKSGFSILFKGRRSYLDSLAGQEVPLYILGRELR